VYELPCDPGPNIGVEEGCFGSSKAASEIAAFGTLRQRINQEAAAVAVNVKLL